MNKYLKITSILIIIILITGCHSNKLNKEFKKEYESVNNKENKYGIKNRTVNIPNNNPYEKTTPENILKMINNKETFYVYFGDKLCPWCRSVIEKSIEVANNNNIKKIYYVNIWDDDGNEILRDKYKVENNEAVLDKKGTKTYYKLLKELNNVLSDYALTNESNELIETNEKRIYAPNFIYIKNGKALKLITGISSKQTNPNSKLTKNILKDEEEQFNEFFNNK